MSVHGIVQKEPGSDPVSTVFGKIQTALLLCLSLLVLALILLLTGCGYTELLLAVNAMSTFYCLCNLILEWNLKNGKSQIVRESNYHAALQKLKHEEQLKAEFADFLHDDVLQDLLAVKNMMAKAHRPDIQDLILETLDALNIRIRKQMQDYHPAILKNLTAKENFQNLIETVSQSFPQRNVAISFVCADNLFLVEPYTALLYRIFRELLTNVFKHSDGSNAQLMLTQKDGVIGLYVSDDGTASADSLLAADRTKHKGIASVMEQVSSMEGSMRISDNTPHGVCIQITIPMKGADSYQYFISR